MNYAFSSASVLNPCVLAAPFEAALKILGHRLKRDGGAPQEGGRG